jgi:hypothetical protein
MAAGNTLISEIIQQADAGDCGPAIEAVKRYIHNAGASLRVCRSYQGESGPEPTPAELAELVAVLCDHGSRLADMMPLQVWLWQDQRRLSPGIATSGMLLPQQHSPGEWVNAALRADAALNDLKRRAEQRSDEDVIELVPAGFRLRGGEIEPLSGKPLAMLRALLAAPDWRLCADDIREAVWPDDNPTYPEQAVKDTAAKLREALRQALRRRGIKVPGDPLPSKARGADLTYQLDLSCLQKQ